MTTRPISTVNVPLQLGPEVLLQRSMAVLLVPADVFSDPSARENRNDLLYRMENEFATWRAGMVSAGSVLEECPLRVAKDSFVITILFSRGQIELVRKILENAVDSLLGAEYQLCFYYTETGRGDHP